MFEEFEFPDVSKERLHALVDDLLTPQVETVVRSPGWQSRYGRGYGVGRVDATETLRYFGRNALLALQDWSKAGGHPPKAVSEFVALAGIDARQEERRYRVVFQPQLRLLAPLVLADMLGDAGVDISHLELGVVHRGQDDARVVHPLSHSNVENKLGARRNVLVAFASGEIAGQPCHLATAAAPIDSHSCAVNPETALTEAAEAVLDLLDRAATLCEKTRPDAAQSLRKLPVLVGPLMFGKPLGRGRRALLAHDLVPATNWKLADLIRSRDRKLALALTGRPFTRRMVGTPAPSPADRLDIGTSARSIDAAEAHRYSATLLESGLTTKRGARTLRKLGLEVVEGGDDQDAWLLPIAQKDQKRRPNAILRPRVPVPFQDQVSLGQYGTALHIDLEARTARWWLIDSAGGFLGLTRAMRTTQMVRARSCERRYRERVSALMHLPLSASADLLDGAEGAMLAVNLLYVWLGLDEPRRSF